MESNNNSNLDLFIATHKDFNVPVTDNAYKIITLNKPDLKISNTNLKIYDDTKGYNISKKQHGYSELSAFYYVYKNLTLKDYIGFNHYRRYFPFYLNVNEIFKNYDIITPAWYSFENTVENIFKMYHFEDDIILIEYIIKKYFPDYAEDYDKYIKNNIFTVLNINEKISNIIITELYTLFFSTPICCPSISFINLISNSVSKRLTISSGVSGN